MDNLKNNSTDKTMEEIKLKYFKKSDFSCKCGCETNLIKDEFTQALDKAREISGVSYIITSGFRCKKHPLSIKSPSSSHIKGIAADIKFTNGKKLALILSGLGGVGFKRFGISFNCIKYSGGIIKRHKRETIKQENHQRVNCDGRYSRYICKWYNILEFNFNGFRGCSCAFCFI